jgi:hypothetical protein
MRGLGGRLPSVTTRGGGYTAGDIMGTVDAPKGPGAFLTSAL